MPCILLSFVCLYFIRGGGGVLFVLGRGGVSIRITVYLLNSKFVRGRIPSIFSKTGDGKVI